MIAYLILVHDQPHWLGRLIKTLQDEDVWFFVHVDAKSDITMFQTEISATNVTFLEERIECHWGTFSLAEAALSLIKAAVATDESFECYCLLTGSDFPIAENAAIRAALATDREYMRIDRPVADRAERYLGPIRDRPELDFERGVLTLNGDSITLYHGSGVWSLSHSCIQYILDFLRLHPEYPDYFQSMPSALEIFFQSVVKHSPFASAISHDIEAQEDQTSYFASNEHGCHFIDWQTTPRSSHPKVMDESDCSRLRTSNALFARKFRSPDSETLWLKLMADKGLPGISCICLTYARPQLLEEAIYSFLQQDYPGPKELIVLNDYAPQTLVYEHPDVRVINLVHRFRTVGEKMNAATALAKHDLLCVWDDDDIYLPHRLSYSAARVTDQFYKPAQAWWWNSGQISGPSYGKFHVACCYPRDLFNLVGGYQAMGNGYDQVFEEDLHRAAGDKMEIEDVPIEELYFIYRWGGTGSFHMSGMADWGEGQTEATVWVQEQVAQGEIPAGRIHLHPHWKQAYPQLIQDALPPP